MTEIIMEYRYFYDEIRIKFDYSDYEHRLQIIEERGRQWIKGEHGYFAGSVSTGGGSGSGGGGSSANSGKTEGTPNSSAQLDDSDNNNNENSSESIDISEWNGIIISGQEYLDSMPKLENHDIDDCYNTTNPNYAEGEEYQKNCQRCVVAYEARRRGYDVIAKGSYYDTDPFKKDDCLNGWGSMFDITENDVVKIDAKSGAEAKESISKKMAGYGDGARTIVKVIGDDGDGHVFIAEQVNKKTRFIDPQIGLSNAEVWFSVKDYNHKRTQILRVDDKKFNDNVKRCVEKGE